MKQEEIIEKYLYFKNICVNKNIIDLDEIIKLFEVWIRLLLE